MAAFFKTEGGCWSEYVTCDPKYMLLLDDGMVLFILNITLFFILELKKI